MKDEIDLSKAYFDHYQDRGIKKWAGFYLSEHTTALTTDKKQNEVIERLPQQSLKQIDYCLARSTKYNKIVEIQLNTLDDLGHVQPHIIGTFRGFADLDTVVINTIKNNKQYDRYIDYSDIRHIIMRDFIKWSDTDQAFDDNLEIPKEIDEFCDDFFDDGDFWE